MSLSPQELKHQNVVFFCENRMQNYVPLLKQNVMKRSLYRQRIDQKRKKGWDGEEGEERGLRKGAERG